MTTGLGEVFNPLLMSHVSRHTLIYKAFVCGYADGFQNDFNQGGQSLLVINSEKQKSLQT